MVYHLLVGVVIWTTATLTYGFNLRPEAIFQEDLPNFGFAVATKYNSSTEFIATGYDENDGGSMHCNTSPPSSCASASWPHSPSVHYGVSAAYGHTRSVVGAYRYGSNFYGRVFQYRNGVDDGYFNGPGGSQAGSSVAVVIHTDVEWIVVGEPARSLRGSVQVYRSDSKNTRITLQLPNIETQAFFGYAVAGGDIDNDGVEDIIVSAPKEDLHSGVVTVYKGRDTGFVTTPMITFRGTQVGAYFGASMVVADFNNDNENDICIGAPQFGTPDFGQVRCFFNIQDNTETAQELNGRATGERFGFSMSSGDFDDDGYHDLVVGAPFYEQMEGINKYRGRVFIFNGRSGIVNGVTTAPSQTLFGQTEDSRFGFSISAFRPGSKLGFVVGSPGENKVTEYLAKPVIDLTVSMSASPDRLQVEDRLLNLTITFRVEDGQEIPANGLIFSLSIDSRAKKNTTDVTENRVITAPINSIDASFLVPISVLETANLQSLLNPLVFVTTWRVADIASNLYSLRPGPDRVSHNVPFITGCGGVVCESSLFVSMTASSETVVAGNEIEFSVSVKNNGPDIAYKPTLTFTARDNLFINELMIDENADAVCQKTIDNLLVFCNFDKLQNQSSTALIVIKVNTKDLEQIATVVAEASTISLMPEEPNGVHQPEKNITVSQITFADAAFTGVPKQSDQANISANIVAGRDIMKHTFTIVPSVIGYADDDLRPSVKGVSATIYWPYGFLYITSISLGGGASGNGGLSGSCTSEYVDCSQKAARYRGETENLPEENENNCPNENVTCMVEDPRFPVYNSNAKGITTNIISCLDWWKVYIRINCSITSSIPRSTAGVIAISFLPNTDFIKDPKNSFLNDTSYTWAPSFGFIEVSSESIGGDDDPFKPYETDSIENNHAHAHTLLKPFSEHNIVILVDAKKDPTPLWVIIVPIVVGLLLILITLGVLTKLGFFKRKRAPLADDAEPPGGDDPPEGNGPGGDA